MKLHVHEAGTGDDVALLIHGGGADHRTWHAVENELLGRGYRVIAPDLRGHGQSPRGEYTPESLADDLVENLPGGAKVAIGHSLGGLALALAVERLAPEKAVYSDPGFRLDALPPGALEMMKQMFRTATAESVRSFSPRWSDKDIDVELAALKLHDPAFLDAVATFAPDYLPAAPVVPSLVQLADPSLTVNPALAQELARRGFTVRSVPQTGHCIHRDDLEGFFTSLDGFI